MSRTNIESLTIAETVDICKNSVEQNMRFSIRNSNSSDASNAEENKKKASLFTSLQ
jgi:hypothetical protein